jgi:hypothetical protein
MVRERAGVQMGNSHATAIELEGCIKLLVSDGTNAGSAKLGPADARHLATLLRRVALRVERQGLR